MGSALVKAARCVRGRGGGGDAFGRLESPDEIIGQGLEQRVEADAMCQ